jgi:RNA-directed DNA polymerase
MGFAPGAMRCKPWKRRAIDIGEGRRWVVDLDLEKFFDRVNHDVLVARVARGIADARVLKRIRRFLEAGRMAEGMTAATQAGHGRKAVRCPHCEVTLCSLSGTGSGRPRGLAFCRYADDSNIDVRSQKAGARVMRGIRAFLEKVLRLRI